MPNLAYSLEWNNLASRHLETAAVLLRENHYTDSIAIEIHQALEKSFKSVYAYLGVAIPRTHSLTILFGFVQENIDLRNIDIDEIITISDYYETDRYPGPKYIVPTRTEVDSHFQLAEQLIFKIKGSLI